MALPRTSKEINRKEREILTLQSHRQSAHASRASSASRWSKIQTVTPSQTGHADQTGPRFFVAAAVKPKSGLLPLALHTQRSQRSQSDSGNFSLATTIETLANHQRPATQGSPKRQLQIGSSQSDLLLKKCLSAKPNTARSLRSSAHGNHTEGSCSARSSKSPCSRTKVDWMEWNDPFPRRMRLQPAWVAEGNSMQSARKGTENYIKQKTDCVGIDSSNAFQGQRSISNIDGKLTDSLGHGLSIKHFDASDPYSDHLREARPMDKFPCQSKKHNGAVIMTSKNSMEWDRPTVAERVLHQGQTQGAGLEALLERHGKSFEDHCLVQILSPTMNEIHWGDVEHSSERGGLSDLKSSMVEAETRTPMYLNTIQKGIQFFNDLTIPANTNLIRKGTTHATVTKMMAREFVHAFGEEGEDHVAEKDIEINPSTQEDPLDKVNIERTFMSQFNDLKAVKFNLPTAKDILNAKSSRASAKLKSKSAGQSKGERKEDRKGFLMNLVEDVSFEMDITFMKLRERDLLGDTGNSGKIISADAGMSDTTYYLRISVREALNLPKMDDTKDSYCDTYCRCSIQSKGSIVKGPKGPFRRETKCIWNSKDPAWKQDISFVLLAEPVIHSKLDLLFEVFDVNLGQHGKDHFIGKVEIMLFRDGKRCLALEKEIEESYQILNASSEMVRCNHGVVNAEKLGRSSMLKLKLHLSTRPELQPLLCAKLIQQNVRCMLARRKLTAIKKFFLASFGKTEVSQVRQQLTLEQIWKIYTDACAVHSTTPIRTLKDQLHTKILTLRSYAVTLNATCALCDLIDYLVVTEQLYSLTLTNLGLRSPAICVLAKHLSEAKCLKVLILDGNPIASETPRVTTFSNDTKQHIVSSVKALTDFVSKAASLIFLSLAYTHLDADDLVSITNSAAENEVLRLLNLQGNHQELTSQSVRPASAISKMLKSNPSMIEIDISYNRLCDAAAIEFFGGCLASRLRRLHLRRTGICKTESINRSLAQYIESTSCCLEFLDLSYCEMEESGAMILSEAAKRNVTLQILILDGNKFGQMGYLSFLPKEGRARVITEWDADAVDNHAEHTKHPMQTPLPDLLQAYIFVSAFGNYEHRLREWLESIAIHASDEEIRNLCEILANGRDGFELFYQWYCRLSLVSTGYSVLLVSLQECGCPPVSKQLDVTNPFRDYNLNLSLVECRTILLHLMKLVYSGLGKFMPGATLCDQNASTKQIVNSPYTVRLPSDISLWTVPDRGFLHLTVGSVTTSSKMEEDDVQAAQHTLEESLKHTSSGFERISLIEDHFRMCRSKTTYRNALSLLKLLGRCAEEDALRRSTLMEERIAVAVITFDNLLQPKQKFQLLEHLNFEERAMAEEQLGMMPFSYNPKNLTGHYELHLSNSIDREIALKLLERRNALRFLTEKRLHYAQLRKGGTRTELEFIWRNARVVSTSAFDATAVEISRDEISDYKLPPNGMLYLDFVDINESLHVRRIGGTSCSAMEANKFASLLGTLRQLTTVRQKLAEIRRQSNDNFFTCLQIVALIELFDISSIARYSRVEAAVCLYTCTIDWRAFHYVLRHVGAGLMHDVEYRLGKANLYHDEVSSPVRWWHLDLESVEDRWLMQELVHLAHVEPGENIVDCKLDDCPFVIPRAWLFEVPHKHRVTFFYCRTDAVIDRCMQHGCFQGRPIEDGPPAAHSFPPYYQIPSTPSNSSPHSEGAWTWMDIERIRVVADTLRRFGREAEAMFNLIDTDRGGEISRAEFSVGLLRLGIWLPPDQLKLLFSMIDLDGSGDISLVEFMQFWVNAPPLRQEDIDQQAYWKVRGVPFVVYESMVRLYDVRALYAPGLSKLYGMEAHSFTLLDEPGLEVTTLYSRDEMRLVAKVGQRNRAKRDSVAQRLSISSVSDPAALAAALLIESAPIMIAEEL